MPTLLAVAQLVAAAAWRGFRVVSRGLVVRADTTAALATRTLVPMSQARAAVFEFAAVIVAAMWVGRLRISGLRDFTRKSNPRAWPLGTRCRMAHALPAVLSEPGSLTALIWPPFPDARMQSLAVVAAQGARFVALTVNRWVSERRRLGATPVALRVSAKSGPFGWWTRNRVTAVRLPHRTRAM
jgi:hypothetical protein